jgi:hypothetical protein
MIAEPEVFDPYTATDEQKRIYLLRREALALAERKLNIARANVLAFYKPHEKQDAFHKAGNKKRRMCSAGNRFGKSHMGCAEDCAWLQGERVWYPKTDSARSLGIPKRPVKGLVITTDWDKVDEVWTCERGDQPGKMFKMLPPDFVKSKRRNHSGAIDLIECANGSTIRFDTVKSFMANPQGSESAAYDFIHVDEPCPQQMWKAASRGLMDTHGSAWFTLTPLAELWINDMFFPNPALNFGKKESELADRSQYWAIRATTYENTSLTTEAIEAFKAELSVDEIQCRLNGIPLALSGMVYKEFNFATHVLSKLPFGWDDWHRPPRNYSIYYYIDPHPQTPHAVLFFAVSPHGQIFAFNEIFEHTTISALSAMIESVVKDYCVIWAKCDPLAWINNPVDDSNMAEEFARCGVFVDKATKALEHGILEVKSLLKKPGAFYVCPTMGRFLFEINRYAWAKDNKPVDKDDHMMENLYRAVLDKPFYCDPDKAASKPTNDIVIDKAEINDEEYARPFED